MPLNIAADVKAFFGRSVTDGLFFYFTSFTGALNAARVAANRVE